MESFEMWYTKLHNLAQIEGYLYLVGDKESHRESFEDGESPEDELKYQIQATSDSM